MIYYWNGVDHMFSDELAAIRRSLGLNQKEFAEAIGVTPSAVCAWEVGRVLPNDESSKTLHEFCIRNNIDFADLRDAYLSESLKSSFRKYCSFSWNEGFKKLCQYLQENGSYPDPTSELGIWVSQQRKNYVSHRGFTEKHIQMLNSIGFQWKADEGKEAEVWAEAEWMKHYNHVLKRIEASGQMPNDAWITQQLKLPEQTEEHQRLLNELGIRMVPGSTIRNARGDISQTKLAKALGVSTVTVSHWENRDIPEYKVWDILKVIDSMKK